MYLELKVSPLWSKNNEPLSNLFIIESDSTMRLLKFHQTSIISSKWWKATDLVIGESTQNLYNFFQLIYYSLSFKLWFPLPKNKFMWLQYSLCKIISYVKILKSILRKTPLSWHKLIRTGNVYCIKHRKPIRMNSSCYYIKFCVYSICQLDLFNQSFLT